MSRFFCRRRVLLEALTSGINKFVVQDLAAALLGLYSNSSSGQGARLLGFKVKSSSTEADEVKVEQNDGFSFTVSYLINSCGLSPEIANSVSKNVKLNSCEQPDAVLKIFRKYGFGDAHIAKLVRVRPSILLAHPDKVISPKLEFFNSIGITDAELASVCSSNPAILGPGLENRLIPNYKFLKNVLHSDENVIKAFRKKSWLFQHDLPTNVSPRLEVLKKLGVPESFISLILICYSPIVLQREDKFHENVKRVIEMGFDPKRTGFIHAMQVIVSLTQKTWEGKLEVLKKLGWSEDDIRLALRRYPNYMSASEQKITNAMNFLVKMGWQPRDTAGYPDVFLMSFEKRVVPRCSVIKLLQSKGLVKEAISLRAFLDPVEMKFLDKYVTKYIDNVPELLNIYNCQKGNLAIKADVSSSQIQNVPSVPS